MNSRAPTHPFDAAGDDKFREECGVFGIYGSDDAAALTALGALRAGAGLVLLGTGATVIPVTITGLDRVLPIGSVIPRIGHRVDVYFGKPVDYSDLAGRTPSRETAQEVVDRVMERIRFQRRVIERLRAR